MPQITISDAVYKRLEQHATGFDTPEQVILRLLNLAEGTSTSKPELVFSPIDDKAFKSAFLASGHAEIALYYNSGKRDVLRWEAKRFSDDSNLRANLWSGHLRNWKDKGIIKAEFSALPRETSDPEDETIQTRIIAHAINLKYEELDEVHGLFEVHERRTNDDMLVGYYVEFDRDTPQELLGKVSGLSGHTVDLSVNLFDNPYYDEEP
ncbi:hypothetical protein ACQ8YR_002631 [Yersinia enterocolitica]|nr:hypothetical protein [Yersinia enterocolitica]EKN5021395.1 hypothetical protein [Yersinia enterocolitica]EKN5065968.1 hypothetical protein [Yersinia enterocolitica]EKN5131637.1 hypothetical protein [Yersinia enterocolitica]HDL6991969.1 hypothetical protein [Yersinia enterocolitica]